MRKKLTNLTHLGQRQLDEMLMTLRPRHQHWSQRAPT